MPTMHSSSPLPGDVRWGRASFWVLDGNFPMQSTCYLVCDEMLPFDARCSEPPTTTQVFSAPSPRGPGKAVVSERAGMLA